MLVILRRFMGRLFFWTAVLATAALFGTTAIMALLIWGFFEWFNENAAGWQRTFSQASAFFLVAVNLDFVQSGGVSKGVEHPAVYSARNFYQFRAGLRRGKIFLLRPDVSSDQTDGVGESRVGFGIPRR